MSPEAEFWLALAGVIVPSAVVVIFALLNYLNIRWASASSEKRDDRLGDKIDDVGRRLEGRIDSLRGDVTQLVGIVAYARGRQDAAEGAGRDRRQGPDDVFTPGPGSGPPPS